MTQCPCGSGQDLDRCCAPYIDGNPAPTAEALLRSRYTAYVLGNVDYIAHTMSMDIRDTFDQIEAENTVARTTWQGLEIREIADGGEDDDSGTVEFTARFEMGGENRVHHERANFRREDGKWMVGTG